MYKLCPLDKNNQQNCVYHIEKDMYIPFDEKNSHYQIYKLWLEEGNVPEPAEEFKPDYRALRQAEYPSIGDQLDALFHAGLMPLEMAIKIQAVKAKYPKV